MANESEQQHGGEPVIMSAITNGNHSQEPSPSLQAPSIIPSIKITKVCFRWLLLCRFSSCFSHVVTSHLVVDVVVMRLEKIKSL